MPEPRWLDRDLVDALHEQSLPQRSEALHPSQLPGTGTSRRSLRINAAQASQNTVEQRRLGH